MTSFKKIIAGLFASAMCFSFFAASPKIDYVKLGTENTPENSVVMIFAGYNEFAVRQINPEFPVNKFEVKEIVAEGVEFDPKVHQAVLMEHDETKPSGVVLEVLQKGYKYKDRVIRPAMVKVNE